MEKENESETLLYLGFRNTDSEVLGNIHCPVPSILVCQAGRRSSKKEVVCPEPSCLFFFHLL